MKKFIPLSLLIFFISSLIFAAEGKTGAKIEPANPLMLKFNQVIDFSNLTTDNIKEATNAVIEKAKKDLQKIYEVKKEDRDFNNTMLALDDVYNEVGSEFGVIYLMGNVLVDNDVRNEANGSISTFQKFLNDVSLDENLYNAVKDYSQTKEAKDLTGYKKKFVDETVLEFERNGFALSKEKRNEL